MIDAKDFVEAARQLDFDWYCGVPCSYLTPFINYVINDNSLNYISSANEGDAVATACGATIGGKRAIVMMQNSGLGNAVSPLTSLAHVFRIPVLIICTHRGQPGVSDEPQHELMGEITHDLFDTMRIPWEQFPDSAAAIPATLARADKYMTEQQRPYALVMSKGTVAPQNLLPSATDKYRAVATIQRAEPKHSQAPTRHAALSEIVRHTATPEHVVIATTGFTGRELYAVEDRKNHFYMVGSMGCASSLGLGLALARPDLTVTIVDGDGAGLMRMGNFATLGHYATDNLLHILLDNEAHDSTGAQSTVTASTDFAAIARACGYRGIWQISDVEQLNDIYTNRPRGGASFVHMKITTGTIDKLPRPDVTPAEVYRRLTAHIGATS